MAATVTETKLAIAGAVQAVAKEAGRSPAQVAINWVARRPGVVIPIVGARRLAQIKDNLGGLDFELDEGQRRRLDEASAIEPGFPHDFLGQDAIRAVIHGETRDLIDTHRAGRDGR